MPKRPPISDLIGKTPGAQPREDARRNLASRREKSRTSQEPPAQDFAATEPDPLIDSEAFAQNFFDRLMHKEAPPVRGMKPRLVAKDDDTDPKKPK